MLILLAGGDATTALCEGSTAAGAGPAPDAAAPEPPPPGRPELDPHDELDAEWRLWCGGHVDEGRPRGWPALGASRGELL